MRKKREIFFTEVLHVKLTKEMDEKLRRQAEDKGLTVSHLIRFWIMSEKGGSI